ncbi:hypothetical protein [Streptomyces jumonjinensis]|uniref:hypothetical protein n=1 Tax=Streptomyces jumonjinensis TaxID=1945 RepID=UPI00379D8359
MSRSPHHGSVKIALAGWALVLVAAGCGAPDSGGSGSSGKAPENVPAKPSKPVTIDAMAVMYTLSMLVLPAIALRFVNPAQLVTRVKEDRTAG